MFSFETTLTLRRPIEASMVPVLVFFVTRLLRLEALAAAACGIIGTPEGILPWEGFIRLSFMHMSHVMST